MWLPLVLACGAAHCFAVSGPAFPDERTCRLFLQAQAVPYVAFNSPEAPPVDAKCVQWPEKS
jgi:hypothetical protein